MQKKSMESQNRSSRDSLSKFALLSMGTAIVTMAMKAAAFWFTGSIGLLSDAMESVVNLVGAAFAFVMLKIAARPADTDHSYGHTKAEYFASTIESLLILIAAASIVVTAVNRLLDPRPLEQLGVGLLISFAASLVNLFIAQVLIRTGKKHDSITLEADGHHLMTDVWTSVGVGAGLILVLLTGWSVLDPIAAILIAVNIVWTAFKLLKRSVAGFMDASLGKEDLAVIEKTMNDYRTNGFDFHALRTRVAASRKFVSVHMLADGGLTLHDAHHRAEDFEKEIRELIPGVVVTTHLEPIGDDISIKDENENL